MLSNSQERIAAMEQTAFVNVMVELIQKGFYDRRVGVLQKVNQTFNSKKSLLWKFESYPFLKQVMSLFNLYVPLTDVEKNEAIDAVISSNVYDKVKEKEDNMKPSDFDHVDELVKELLKWFKADFFTWVNKLGCVDCGNEDLDKIRQVPGCRPYKEEHFTGKASIIERYQCLKCRSVYEFPRYNDIRTLLNTRRGRCGEWNNCFIAILRSLDIDVRYIWNAEDHVWCEYFSHKQSRWIHLDCCENSYDQPLLYNDGWGKKMSYVFAITDKYIVDVTKKYLDPTKPERALPRNKAPEPLLVAMLAYTNSNKLMALPRDELLKVTSQLVADYKSQKKFINKQAQKTTEDPMLPRSSGDVSWTSQRGEAGDKRKS